MPTRLQISQLGEPILKEKASPIQDVKDPIIQGLIDNMIETCSYANGVGLAAPQVFQPIQIFVFASKPIPCYPNAPVTEPMAVINPVIRCSSDEMVEGWEGCLSIPGLRGLVSRHQSVTVSFTNRDGEQEERTFYDFVARIFQHENDHLQGIIFLERTNPRELVTDMIFQRNCSKDAKGVKDYSIK